MKSASRFLFVAIVILFTTITTHAIDVTLTSGQVSNFCGATRTASATLIGEGFTLRYEANSFTGLPPGFLDCSIPVTTPISTFLVAGYEALGSVSLAGVGGTPYMRGSLTFTENFIFGTVVGLDPSNPALEIFTVNFIGQGIGIQGINRADFTVTPSSPVPEPATMLLLGTGLAGIAASVRRRAKAR